VRPAAAAIAELAPENSFYAEGRKVTIDGVIFDREDLVAWRLCPNCTWMEREGEHDLQPGCPKCGHQLWSDEGQRHVLLRMREVVANTEDRASRSYDERDDREPKFYEKNVFVLKDDQDVTEAWYLDCDEAPFGFEFFRKITLREVNFGEKNGGGTRVFVAGRERTARAFELCEACGKVKRDGEILHSPWCPYRKDPEKEKAVRTCYLYREFTSEAIRMLLPVSAMQMDRKVESFIAALELGLRKKFQGDPGHLNTTVYDEPIEGSEARRRFLVLYDGVPGGTGYLKELMRAPAQIREVFQNAFDALSVCECRLDPRKDGCYQCLLAYRGRHFQGKTSRSAALDLLRSILDNWDKLKVTDRLETIRISALLESELEAGFLEALARLREGEPPRYLTDHVVNGKPGKYLRIPDHGAWLIEPQVELGPDRGVSVASRADFVLYPERPFPGELPIAVFADGYEWHADPFAGNLRTGKDSAQRLSIARSGRYRVWSVTWSDVYDRLDKPQPQVIPLGGAPGSVFPALVAQIDPANAAAWQRLYSGSSFDMLLYLLTAGRQAAWEKFAQATLLHLMQGDIRQGGSPETIRAALQDGNLPANWTAAPVVATTGGAGAQPAGWLYRTLERPDLKALACLSLTDAQTLQLGGIGATLRLMDDQATGIGASWKAGWREFLRMSNLLQFVPKTVWITSLGLAEGIYGGLLEPVTPVPPQAAGGAIDVLVAEILDKDAREIAIAVYGGGRSLPVPGYEIADPAGEIVAVAELAWSGQTVCVMTSAQMEHAEAARGLGWTVFAAEALRADIQALLAILPVRDEQ
jgi:DEAD/DEAH box helicase domain-containing protein